MPERYPSEDPREWINRAKSNLALAEKMGQNIYLEDLCFNTQQAVEKAIKSLLIKYGIDFPFTHDIAKLITLLLKTELDIPEFVEQAVGLTPYATFARYPNSDTPVTDDDYKEALEIAEKIVNWVESIS